MFSPLIQTVWGVPVLRIFEASCRADAALQLSHTNFAQNPPCLAPASICALVQQSKSFAPNASFVLHGIPLAPKSPSAAKEIFLARSGQSPWSLPLDPDLVSIPRSSGKVSPIDVMDRSGDYAAREIRLLIGRLLQLKQTGSLISSDIETLLGDLWSVLNEIAAAGREEENFWIFLIHQLMWGKDLENPANHFMSTPIIQRFLSHFDRLTTPEQRIAILGAVLKGPIVTRRYTQIADRFFFLQRIVPSLKQEIIARKVILEAIYLALCDPYYEYETGLERLVDFLGEERIQKYEITAKADSLWSHAMCEAWRRTNAEGILRLEEIARQQKWVEEPWYATEYKMDRDLAYAAALNALRLSTHQSEPLVRLAAAVETVGLTQYRTELKDYFATHARVRPDNMRAYASFLVALQPFCFPRDISEYQITIMANYKSWLQEKLAGLIGSDPDTMLELHLASLDADRILREGKVVPTFRETTASAVNKQIENIVEGALMESNRSREARELHWQALRRDYCNLTGESGFKVDEMLKTIVLKKVEELFKQVPPRRSLVIPLSTWETRASAMSLSFDFHKIIVAEVLSILGARLFTEGPQTPSERNAFLEAVFAEGQMANYLEDVAIIKYPWETPTGGLRNRSDHLAIGYLEGSTRLASHLRATPKFFTLLQAELEAELRLLKDPLIREYKLQRLHQHASQADLRGVLLQIAARLSILLT